LDITKDAITQACDEYSIPYFIDATNKKLITPRNVIRNSITPQIQKLHA
jgi:tRNA(Ile)-lysidine synthase TilS/MesJ